MILCKLVLFLILHLFLEKSKESSIVPEEIVQDLYTKYKEAVLDEKLNSSSRRLFTRNKQYEIHVKKLKEVNGFKKHNLMIKEYKENLRTGDNRDNNPFIYINNPVESKIPKSFLTLQEFKEVLTNRVKLQRNEVTTKKFLNILNETKITTSRMKNKNYLDKNQSKIESKKLQNMTKTRKLKQANATIVKNIVIKYNNNVKTKIPTRFLTIVTTKPMININTAIKLGTTNKFINFSKESTTEEIESVKTNEFKLRNEYEMKNIDFRAELPKNYSIHLSTTITKTEFDNITNQVTTVSNDDRISMISGSLHENELKNYTEKQSNNTFTVIFNSKTEAESTTQTNVRSVMTLKTNQLELTNENINLQPDSSKNSYINLPKALNKTRIDNNNTIDVTTTSNDDKTSIIADLLNENQLKNSTEEDLNDTFTTIFDGTTEEESTTKSLINVSSEISSNETEPTTDTTTTNVVTEKTTLTKIGVSTTQVRRKTAKSKRATTQKASNQVPRKRSTLGRPLVFMGSR